MLMDGLREVEIIEDCHCEAKVTSCVRAPSLRTYFFETPYETVIDVGKCVGSKGEPGKKVAKKTTHPMGMPQIYSPPSHEDYLI